MEHLRDFTFRLSPPLRTNFKDFLVVWELNRTYYMFQRPGASGGLSVYDLERLRVVNSAETDTLVAAVCHDPDFAELAAEDRYGPVNGVETLTIDQIRSLVVKMSQRSDIAFFNSDFEIINAEIETLL